MAVLSRSSVAITRYLRQGSDKEVQIRRFMLLTILGV